MWRSSTIGTKLALRRSITWPQRRSASSSRWLSSISIGLQDDSLRPTLDLLGLEILNGQGNQIAALPKLRTKLDTSELLLGRVALETLELDGATIRMTRDVDGVLRFAFGAQMGGLDAVSGSLGDVMTTFDAMFADPRLRELEEVHLLLPLHLVLLLRLLLGLLLRLLLGVLRLRRRGVEAAVGVGGGQVRGER